MSRPLFTQIQEADALINTQQDAISYRLATQPRVNTARVYYQLTSL